MIHLDAQVNKAAVLTVKPETEVLLQVSQTESPVLSVEDGESVTLAATSETQEMPLTVENVKTVEVPVPGGTFDHAELQNREKPDQHPISAITGLEKALQEIESAPGPAGPPGPAGADGQPGKDGAPGADGYTPQRGVDYWTPSDKQEILNELSLALPSTPVEVFVTRYSVSAVYKANTYTDVNFDIYKEGYTPVSIIPRTSGNDDVLVLGYGFFDNGGQGEVDYSKATVTFRNIGTAQTSGGAKLEVVYIKTD